ncbi:pilus assembly protein PilM, partial [bacterium]|nr:pilus assembly protein PilM [bacterium]
EYWHLFNQVIGIWEDQEITLSIAVIRENLLELGGIVQRSGLNPEIIDLNFFNVANLIEHYLTSEEAKGKNIGIVHLGNETTSIGIFKDGHLRTFINRPIGAYDFTKQISKHFHATEKDAEELKRNEPFFFPEPSPEQENLYNYTVIRTTFSTMVREIFGALENYLSRYREFSIHEVILSGGGANFQNISVLLGQNLNTVVRNVSDFYELQITGNPAETADRNSLAPACGAFLRN